LRKTRSFVDHEGFDWEGIQRAMGKNLRRGKIVAGGSDHHPAAREEPVSFGRAQSAAQGPEAILTAMLEAAMDKRRIFEIYLKRRGMGRKRFGAEGGSTPLFRRGRSRPRTRAGGAPGCDAPRRATTTATAVRLLESYSESILEQMPAAQIPRTTTA